MKSLIFGAWMLAFISSMAQNSDCSTLPVNQKPRIVVSRFETPRLAYDVKVLDLAQMLTDKLQQSACFNVLASLTDVPDLTQEIVFAQSGNAENGANSGKMKAPQVIVMGKLVEYVTGEVNGVPAMGSKAKVGFSIQLLNVETREIIASKTISAVGKANWDPLSTINKTLADACEKGMNEALAFITANYGKMPKPPNETGFNNIGYANPATCKMLKNGGPKVMVILPEYHIQRRIPDPAGETEINRKLIQAGFTVIDPAMYATLRNGAQFSEAAKDPMKAISLGKKFGADLVLYGEAFSETAGRQGSQWSSRARVEVRAVKTTDASIVALHGLESGALDVSESVAAKSALRSAGSKVADYLIAQFCTMEWNGKSAGNGTPNPNSKANSGKQTTTITLKSADYSLMKLLAETLAAKGTVTDKSIANSTAKVVLEHTGKTDAIAEYIDTKLGSRFSIAELEDGKITLEPKK
jgi:hypothetical protein